MGTQVISHPVTQDFWNPGAGLAPWTPLVGTAPRVVLVGGHAHDKAHTRALRTQ